jgi:hypothetical protein
MNYKYYHWLKENYSGTTFDHFIVSFDLIEILTFFKDARLERP